MMIAQDYAKWNNAAMAGYKPVKIATIRIMLMETVALPTAYLNYVETGKSMKGNNAMMRIRTTMMVASVVKMPAVGMGSSTRIRRNVTMAIMSVGTAAQRNA